MFASVNASPIEKLMAGEIDQAVAGLYDRSSRNLARMAESSQQLDR
jgi:hypothetical protein